MVVIAEGTRRLLGDLFKLQDLGRTDLKGIHGPVRTWAVLQANSVASRFEALHRNWPGRPHRARGRIRIAASAMGESNEG